MRISFHSRLYIKGEQFRDKINLLFFLCVELKVQISCSQSFCLLQVMTEWQDSISFSYIVQVLWQKLCQKSKFP